jgi:hypothetical protein
MILFESSSESPPAKLLWGVLTILTKLLKVAYKSLRHCSVGVGVGVNVGVSVTALVVPFDGPLPSPVQVRASSVVDLASIGQQMVDTSNPRAQTSP